MNTEAVLDLLATATVPELGPERREGTDNLAPLNRKIDTAIKSGTVHAENGNLIRAIVLLWHDHLDEAHGLAQEIDNADGAFVHGIMHRREPDYGNAAYWFRRVGKHAAFEEMGSRLAGMAMVSEVSKIRSKLLAGGKYDPFAFINLCDGYHARPEAEQNILREVQALETRVLLDHFTGS